jgi:uncharacterized protein YkwD
MRHFLFIILLFFTTTTTTWSQSKFEWPVKMLDTAREVDYLTDDEKDMILELNKVRFNPAEYAKERMKWMGSCYKGKLFKVPGKTDLLTEEGEAAYDECMKYLETAKPAPLLTPSKGMSKACQLLVYDQSATGNTGHKGSWNSTPVERVKKFGTFMGNYAENIHYGDSDAPFSVIALLIDDGVKSRDHRKTIMNPSFNVVGVATGSHKAFGKMFVSTFATSFTEK